MIMTVRRVGVVALAASCLLDPTAAFAPMSPLNVQSKNGKSPLLQLVPDDHLSNADDFTVSERTTVSRRHAISLAVTSVASIIAGVSQEALAADDLYRPAKRPTAYIVDSTIPPTLIPLNAREETKILSGLGRGSGTSKDAIADDSVNLNNILNKAVFGTIDAISGSFSGQDKSNSGPGYASFVCLGLPQETNPVDVDLATDLLTLLLKTRKSIKGETAMGLAFAPFSTQSALDAYLREGNDAVLVEAMTSAGVPESTLKLYSPLLQLAKSRNLKLLALAPELEDAQIVRKQGLQNVNTDRRAQYVADTEGFIALTLDPKFKLYTERSLLKDFEPLDDKDLQGNFFAQRILVHEAAATAIAKYAVSRPDSVVTVIAPTPDLRFLGGINGRIPRVCEFLNKETNKVTNDAVTTILLNPTAKVSSQKPMVKCDLQVASVI
jgi:hypothetical protein